jgi:hypothetical protein
LSSSNRFMDVACVLWVDLASCETKMQKSTCNWSRFDCHNFTQHWEPSELLTSIHFWWIRINNLCRNQNSKPELPIEIKLIPSLTEPLSDLALGNIKFSEPSHSSKLKAEKKSCEHIILHLIYDFPEDIFQTLDDPTCNSSQTVILFLFPSQIISAQEFNFL